MIFISLPNIKSVTGFHHKDKDLGAYSGGTVRESHAVHYSLSEAERLKKHLNFNYEYIKAHLFQFVNSFFVSFFNFL